MNLDKKTVEAGVVEIDKHNLPSIQNPGIRFWIESIIFSDNTKLDFKPNDIIVFVGANNAGKSAALKEILNLTSNKKYNSKVLKYLDFRLEGNDTTYFEYLNNVSKVEGSSSLGVSTYKGLDFTVRHVNKQKVLEDATNGLKDIANVFIKMLSTEKRISEANPAPNIQTSREPLTHAIHYLQKDDKLEHQFSAFFKQAFGTDLIVHRNAGQEVPLYAGEKPVLQAGDDRASEGYIQELETREPLHHQGDGMRSFVGVLLNTFVAHHPVFLIDEPEAFLHPPQANLLGKMLAENSIIPRQIFLSTHSESFIKGLLDSNNPNLKIVRLQREGSINKANLLDSNDIKEIWSDSLLRHSNILDGLFHKKVIICESDSDIRFYSSVLSAILEKDGINNPDILFIQCGGKHRLTVAIKALKRIGVSINVISDFDVLNSISPLKEIYENLGGKWEDIEKYWKTIKAAIESKKPELETSEIKPLISKIIDSVSEKVFPKEKAMEIQTILRKTSPWLNVKQGGKPFIPSGDATNAFNNLQAKLKEKGFFLVEVGELEGFVRSVGNHGPKWINEVLSKDLKNDPELEVARQFVKQLITQ